MSDTTATIDGAPPMLGDGRKPVGAVLVMGGGIAGVQSAVDLADQGYYVYLVEESPAIGGAMAMLDKTFPTNDCSMCILSPKLVEAERHLNIELITYADVLALEGEPGNFRAKIRKRARSIDAEKCVGCGACIENCVVQNVIKLPEDPASQLAAPSVEDAVMLDDILKRHQHDSANMIAVLQDINEHFRYLPETSLNYISTRLDVPLSQVFHAATFYSAFSLEPRGKHEVKICLGTGCHVRGAPFILDEVCRVLDVDPGQTTKDGMFTVDSVNCVGVCALAPVMVIDEEYYSVKRGTCERIIGKFLKAHEPDAEPAAEEEAPAEA